MWISVITGVGRHSPDGKPKIKPAVLQFLNVPGIDQVGSSVSVAADVVAVQRLSRFVCTTSIFFISCATSQKYAGSTSRRPDLPSKYTCNFRTDINVDNDETATS